MATALRRDPATTFVAHHGMGYTRFDRVAHGIGSTLVRGEMIRGGVIRGIAYGVNILLITATVPLNKNSRGTSPDSTPLSCEAPHHARSPIRRSWP